VRLGAARSESVNGGPACPRITPVRQYYVAAIDVDITLNRYLDHDPQGRMYALEREITRVRAEEAANARAREAGSEPAVTMGLQGDAIQPLTLRVRQGECLRVRLRNALGRGEPASFHLHGAALRVAGQNQAAVASNPAAMAGPGATVTYEWWVRPDEPEGTHSFHSHGNARMQSGHGLFGAVIVEPLGSRFLDARSGRPTDSGWDAIIATRDGRSFREFALYYHEAGDESYQIRAASGEFVPLVDPTLGAYRPGTRALNYRSEPFMNRMQLQRKLTGRFDESLAYSSYAFGDPATPVMRTYLGEPVKERVIHGGSEVFHVHHVHGGSIRWRRQPGAERVAQRGLDKHPPLLPKVSERIDSQGIGPSETYDAENECGAGGCQQSVGDYLFHCHVAHHYFAGMWGIWRVYNTLQDGRASTDTLPPLPELPGIAGRVAAAVTSDALAGRSVDWFGKRIEVDDLTSFVERQLPPAGVPRNYDASVWDWGRDGDRYLGEPPEEMSWPGNAGSPGPRPPLLFDPRSGKLAYPFMRPHFGRRPPFAPNHGPAPYLDPVSESTDTPLPGANGPGSVCPEGTRLVPIAINAIGTAVPLNKRAGIVDPAGEIYVLRQQEDAIRADDSLRRPLAIRANAGRDCLDVVFRSELADSPSNLGFAKANVHIHLVQFDVQASDGLVTGFNYEQSVRPFRAEGEPLRAPALLGATIVRLSSADRFQAGAVIGVGADQDATFEVRRIAQVQGRDLVLDRPLAHRHAAGEIVSAEFVRYRWYPDVQFGTAYFHDHVNALRSWAHGLFGALIAEPPDATWRDPSSGTPIDSGPVADVVTSARINEDLTGSFRELVVFMQDEVPINTVGRSAGSALNLRAEPLADRGRDPTLAFAISGAGPPETPVIRAYAGDPVVLRTLVAGTNDVHTLHVDGHWFRVEPGPGSPPADTIHIGISERADLVLPAAGGPLRMPGDYLIQDGRTFKIREGSWGLLRVLDGPVADLAALPGVPAARVEAPATPAAACPASAPVRGFGVSAVQTPLDMLDGKPGAIFVLGQNASGGPEPLVLHVNVGDCVVIELSNATDRPVSLHAGMLASDPRRSGGVAAGDDPVQAAEPGASRTFTFFASPQTGETVALIRDGADPGAGPGRGLYGAIVVGPAGARYQDPVTGRDASSSSAWAVDVRGRAGAAWRDFTLFLTDEDAGIGTHRMPYTTKVDGPVGLNYRRAPATPVMRALSGDPVRVHVLAPWSEQAHVFSIEGHEWPAEPGLAGGDMLGSVQVGALEAVTLRLFGGAGGLERLPGNYMYGDHREPYREAGLWGTLRVRCRGLGIRPLGRARSSGACRGRSPLPVVLGFPAGALVLGSIVLAARSRRAQTRQPPATSSTAPVM
jgi:FtsP/CotA-like multicopper oxidase with cupredoxin domain